jgi:hypothetical protein
LGGGERGGRGPGAATTAFVPLSSLKGRESVQK